MKNRVLYTTDFGTKLWIGTDHGYCGSSVMGIHQGQVVSGKCRDLRDSIALKHIGLYSDSVRLATIRAGSSRGFGQSGQVFPISEESFASLLAADRRIAAGIAAEQAAAAAAARAEARSAHRTAAAMAVRSRIGARRGIPMPAPAAASSQLANGRPAFPNGADIRTWAHQLARMMQHPGNLAMEGSRIG